MMTNTLAFINAQYLDFRQNTQDVTTLLLQNGQVTGLGYLPDDGMDKHTLVYDLKGCVMVPGIVDTWVNVREPGEEGKETLVSAATAATSGGITSILTSPSTTPCADNPEIIASLLKKSAQVSTIPFYPIGTLSKNRAGQTLSEMGLMRDAGALAFSDTNSLQDIGLMQQALIYAKALNCPVIVSPDEPGLHRGGSMHEGVTSVQKGLKGIPALAEEIRLARDIQLATATGAHIHVFPVSTAGAVSMIREAKAKGIAITAGTAPHYLFFCDTDIATYDTNKKVMPPLRTEKDRATLIEGLRDGTLDCIASHHHPMTIDEKRTDFVQAECGISGLDTFVLSVFDKLVREHQFSLCDAFRLISHNPRKIFHLPSTGAGLLKRPSFTVINPKGRTTFTQNSYHSRGKNSPFIGTSLQGQIVLTVIDGHIVYQDPSVQGVPADNLPSEAAEGIRYTPSGD